jgi:hypothetical protein
VPSLSIACPVCSAPIATATPADDDPATAHDLEWLAELQAEIHERGMAW